MVYVIKEGRIKDNYIKNTKKNVDANLDIAISNNDTKEIIEIKNKCIKALKYINDSKKMKTVKEYYSLPEWILRLLLYCVGIIWIDLDFRGKTKFTKEELVKIEKELNKALDKCNDYIDDHKTKHENAYILTEASNNPVKIKSILKINNNTDLDDETVTKIFNKEYKNIIKEIEKYINEQYKLTYDDKNPASMSLEDCKKSIPEKIYHVEADTINSPKYGDLIYFDIWIDVSKAFAGHAIFCDYYVQLSTHKYINSEFGMHG